MLYTCFHLTSIQIIRWLCWNICLDFLLHQKENKIDSKDPYDQMCLILVGYSCWVFLCLFYVLVRFNRIYLKPKFLNFILCKETLLSDLKQIYWVRAKSNSSYHCYHFRSNTKDLTKLTFFNCTTAGVHVVSYTCRTWRLMLVRKKKLSNAYLHLSVIVRSWSNKFNLSQHTWSLAGQFLNSFGSGMLWSLSPG